MKQAKEKAREIECLTYCPKCKFKYRDTINISKYFKEQQKEIDELNNKIKRLQDFLWIAKCKDSEIGLNNIKLIKENIELKAKLKEAKI